MRLKSFTAWTAAALVAASFVCTAIYAHDEGHEKKAWLGVMIQDDDGARVTGVIDGSAAAEAGIAVGDRVVAVDGNVVGSAKDLTQAIGEREPGDSIRVALVGSSGGEREVTATLGESKARALAFRWSGEGPRAFDESMRKSLEEAMAEGNFKRLELKPQGFLGVALIEPSDALRRSLGGSDGIGVLVNDVTSGSPAETAGLEAGDLIVAVDGESVKGSRALSAAIRAREPGSSVRVDVVRDGAANSFDAVLGESKSRVRYFNQSFTPGENSFHFEGSPMYMELLEGTPNIELDVQGILEMMHGEGDEKHENAPFPTPQEMRLAPTDA